MSSQFALFRTRRFTPMFITQFLGAFNDNVFKQGLILVLTFMAATKLGMAVSLLNNLAALLFVLPFFYSPRWPVKLRISMIKPY